MSDFAALLVDARTKLGLTQSQLAAAAGLTPSYLCFIERRKKPPPSDEVCIRLAEVLQIPADDLIEVAHLERAPEPLRRRIQSLDQTVRRERRSRLKALKSLLSPFLFGGPPGFTESALQTVGISDARKRRIREVLQAVGRKHQDQERAVSRLIDELPERERAALLEALPRMLRDVSPPTAFTHEADGSFGDEVRPGDLLLIDPATEARAGDLVLVRDSGGAPSLNRHGETAPEGLVGPVVEIRRRLRRPDA
jgi:transcriptional regulator with XRE-family HTH domain